MKPIHPGDHGSHVETFQYALIALGYELPRFGADGWFGGETHEAAYHFANDYGYPMAPEQDWVPGDVVKLAIDMHADECAPVPSCIQDFRASHDGRRRMGRREWREITGITLHQTATCFLPQENEKHFSRRSQTAAGRVAKIGVHFVVLRNGLSVWCNPLNYRMPQAQRVFNKTDVGVEIDGYFSGVEGDEKTFWRPRAKPDRKPMRTSEAQFEAARQTLEFIIDEVAKHGGKVKYIHAHRQTSASRRSDPGELIWKNVAMPIMSKHGLSCGGPGFFVPKGVDAVDRDVWTSRGPGRPIPKEWDPTMKYGYFDTPKKATKQT